MAIYNRIGVLVLLLGLILGNISAAAPHASSALVITDYQSEFELITQNPVEKISLTFTNKSPKPISSVQLLIPIDRVVIGSVVEDAYGQPQTLVETNKTHAVLVDQKKTITFREYRIDLNRPVDSEADFKISTIKLYYNSFYEFKPKHIDLFEDQKLLLTAYKVPASPYKIEKVVSTITYGDVGSQRKEKGEASNVNPLSPVSVRLHFVLNIPFVQTSTTKRYVEVSHWGNAYFKDEYKLHNRGAKFRGAFSTIDFHKSRKDTGKNAFRSETIKLPVNAFGLFYRDEIGNISTSTVSVKVFIFYYSERWKVCYIEAKIFIVGRLELHLGNSTQYSN